MSKPDPEFTKVVEAMFRDFMYKVEERCQQVEARSRHVYDSVFGTKYDIAIAKIEEASRQGLYVDPREEFGFQVVGYPVHPEVFSVFMRLLEENRKLNGAAIK